MNVLLKKIYGDEEELIAEGEIDAVKKNYEFFGKKFG